MKWLDELITDLTKLLFSIIPVVMILGGLFTPIAVLAMWYFDGRVNISDSWLIVVGILVAWMGFKWDEATIEHYPTAVERKKNEAKNKN